jgi:formate dehydrogenase major subunit
VNPLRGQNNVQGSCDMGSFPHELPGYRHVKNADVRAIFENAWGVEIDPEPGLRIPNMLDAAVMGPSRGSTARARTSCNPTPTPSTWPPVSRRWNA